LGTDAFEGSDELQRMGALGTTFPDASNASAVNVAVCPKATAAGWDTNLMPVAFAPGPAYMNAGTDTVDCVMSLRRTTGVGPDRKTVSAAGSSMRRSVRSKDSAAPFNGTATDRLRVSLPAGKATTVSRALVPSVRVKRTRTRSTPTCASIARSKPGASERLARCILDGPVLSLVQLKRASTRNTRGIATARRLIVERQCGCFPRPSSPSRLARPAR